MIYFLQRGQCALLMIQSTMHCLWYTWLHSRRTEVKLSRQIAQFSSLLLNCYYICSAGDGKETVLICLSLSCLSWFYFGYLKHRQLFYIHYCSPFQQHLQGLHIWDIRGLHILKKINKITNKIPPPISNPKRISLSS